MPRLTSQRSLQKPCIRIRFDYLIRWLSRVRIDEPKFGWTFVNSTACTLCGGLIAATVLLAIALALGFVFWVVSHRAASKSTSTSQKSIAVMPFANLSHDPDNAYFAEGIQDEMLTRLAKIADLKVISRTSTQLYKKKHA